jgi:hypothetical protein
MMPNESLGDMASALDFVHTSGVAHNDIEPGKILRLRLNNEDTI